MMKPSSSSCWFLYALLGSWILSCVAHAFPEPPIIYYGRVTNKVGKQSRPVLGGTITWTVTSSPKSKPVIVNGPLAPLPDGYSYRIEIPVQKLAGNRLALGTTIEATSDTKEFEVEILVNGERATIVKGSGELDFSEKQRGKTARVDVVVSKPFEDLDGDGLPDWWEDQYADLGFDKFNPNDAAGDLNGDGISNLDEYLNATNPGREFLTYAQWAALHQLSGPGSEESGDFDRDGAMNVVEFALDTDPKVQDRALVEQRARATPIADVGKTALRMIIEIPEVRRDGIEYVIESSIDLKKWTPIAQSADVGYDLQQGRMVRVLRKPRFQFLRLRIRSVENSDLQADAGIWALQKILSVGRTRSGPSETPLSTVLEDPVSDQGATSAITANSITDSTKAWADSIWTSHPHLVLVTTGNAEGRSYLVTAHTATTLTLDTLGADLSTALAAGDLFEIRPARTLSSLFGNPPKLQTGTEAKADLVGLWNGSTFDQYFHDGTSWRTSGADGDRGETVIFPSEGIFLTNTGRQPNSVSFFGLVPRGPRAIPLPPGKTFVLNPSPLAAKLGRTGLAALPGWASTDLVQLWNGRDFKSFFHDGHHWRTQGARPRKDNTLIRRNTAFFIERAPQSTEVIWVPVPPAGR